MPGSIKIDDGSGNYTILTNAGSLGSDKTITIPNETGTLNTISGSVLQVVQGTSTTQTIASTTSYVDLSVSVSITPSSTSSKIFVIVSHFAIITRDGGQHRADIRLVRDSTTLRGDTSTNLYLSGDVQLNYPITLSYLDSPSSTSSLTYKTQGKAAIGGSNERLFTSLGGNLDSIVAMEIGG